MATRPPMYPSSITPRPPGVIGSAEISRPKANTARACAVEYLGLRDADVSERKRQNKEQCDVPEDRRARQPQPSASDQADRLSTEPHRTLRESGDGRPPEHLHDARHDPLPEVADPLSQLFLPEDRSEKNHRRRQEEEAEYRGGHEGGASTCR